MQNATKTRLRALAASAATLLVATTIAAGSANAANQHEDARERNPFTSSAPEYVDLTTINQIVLKPKPGYCSLNGNNMGFARNITRAADGSYILSNWNYDQLRAGLQSVGVSGIPCDGSESTRGSVSFSSPVSIWVTEANPWLSDGAIIREVQGYYGELVPWDDTRFDTIVGVSSTVGIQEVFITRDGTRISSENYTTSTDYDEGTTSLELTLTNTREDTAHAWAVHLVAGGREYTQPFTLSQGWAAKEKNRAWERCQVHTYYYDPSGQPKKAAGVHDEIRQIFDTINANTNITFTEISSREGADAIIEWGPAARGPRAVTVQAGSYNPGLNTKTYTSEITLHRSNYRWWSKPGFAPGKNTDARGTQIARALTRSLGLDRTDHPGDLMTYRGAGLKTSGYFTETDLQGLRTMYPQSDCQDLTAN